jgi:hypothetical protein
LSSSLGSRSGSLTSLASSTRSGSEGYIVSCTLLLFYA